MTPAGQVKTIPLKVGTAATDATAAYTIDRQGFDYCTINVTQSAASATNSADKLVVFKVAHGATTAVSSASDITAFTGSTNTSVTAGFVIAPSSNTASPTTQRLAINCTNKERYLFLILHPDANNGALYAEAQLSRGRNAPANTTDQGVTLFVQG